MRKVQLLHILSVASVCILTVGGSFYQTDCKGLTSCMQNLGSHVKDAVFNFTTPNKDTLRKFYRSLCGDIEDVVQCYHEDNIAGCSQLNSFIQVVPSQDQLRKQFIDICTQSETVIDAMDCFMSKGVTEGLHQCFIALVSHMHLSGGYSAKSEDQCRALSNYNTCAFSVIRSDCSWDTVNFIKREGELHYYTVCSGCVSLTNASLLTCLFIYFIVFYRRFLS